jgi:hypothetical protein
MTPQELSSHTHHQKDYSLLRPFDLEAAKRGEKICWAENGETASEVFFLKSFVLPVFNICVENEQVGMFGEDCYFQFKMSPLAWVEGSPVYKGDVLYNRLNDNKVVFDHMCAACNVESTFTWQKPKTKREGWVNIVKTNYHGNCKEIRDVMIRNCSIYPDKESAKEWAVHCGDVIATVRIEWNE